MNVEPYLHCLSGVRECGKHERNYDMRGGESISYQATRPYPVRSQAPAMARVAIARRPGGSAATRRRSSTAMRRPSQVLLLGWRFDATQHMCAYSTVECVQGRNEKKGDYDAR